MSEPKVILLKDIKNNNIKTGVQYRIIKKSNDDYDIGVWGENILTRKKDSVIFNINDVEPYKYHRGVLGLYHEKKLYLRKMKEYLDKYDVDYSLEEDDDNDGYLVYDVTIISNKPDVEELIQDLQDFEAKFTDILKEIEKKVEEI